MKLSRRNFLGASAAAAAATILGTGYSCSNVSKAKRGTNRTTGTLPNSKFAGVQIGCITYSFRDLGDDVDTTLKACVDAGISSIELMGSGLERCLGAPVNPVSRRATAEAPFTDEEKRSIERYGKALNEWRRSEETIGKYVQLRKKFNDAGVNIHILKWLSGTSDEELDYSFKIAKILGAIGITIEAGDENAKMLGPAAERNGMYAILHNHGQYAEPGFDIDRQLGYSPAVMLNFDMGHYFGSTGLNPADFIRKYHDRIASLHLKDKTGPNNPVRDQNQVWGQGETPLKEVLQLVRDQGWPIYCDIELEYPVVPWSSSVKEVRTCMEYCRQILI
ncbi:MAG TPA: sugar phosphate isomerase/epimerase [Petrimonas sp.]|jgi:sugar phosphate isomerase/epimerase|nr:sugar phosphate isomerase/epimerase [Petrimonas sp.]